MRKFFKYLAYTVLTVFLLLIFLVFLLYLPPVQDFIRQKAVSYVVAHYDWDVRVGKLKVTFPLGVLLEDVYIAPTATDTLAMVDTLRLNVGLKRIWKKEVSIDELALRGAKLGLSNDTSGMKLKVDIGSLQLHARKVGLKEHVVQVDLLRIAQGDVFFNTGTPVSPDTTATKPLDWSFQINRIKLEAIRYRMASATLPMLDAGVISGEMMEGEVALNRQQVQVKNVDLNGGWCNLLTAATDTTIASSQQEKSEAADSAWTVQVEGITLANSAFRMADANGKKMELALSGIGIEVDSVYNRGSVVKAVLKDVRVVQQDGLELKTMQGIVDLDTAYTALGNIFIQTANSRIHLNAHSDASFTELMKKVPLEVTLEGQIGLADVAPFYTGIPAEIRDKSVQLKAVASIKKDMINAKRLALAMPGYFDIQGKGQLVSFQDLRKVSGDVALQGNLPNVTFLNALLKGNNVTVPRNLSLAMNVQAVKGDINGRLQLCQEKDRCVEADGHFDFATETYNGDLTLQRFPLALFLPRDSLGEATAKLRVAGRHWDWQILEADVTMDVTDVTFKGHDYKDISLAVSAKQTHVNGKLESRDPAVPLALVFRGDSVDQHYAVAINGLIDAVHLNALNLVPYHLSAGMGLQIQAALGAQENYALQVRMDSIWITDSLRTYRLGDLEIDLDSGLKRTGLKLASGDFTLSFRTDTSVVAISQLFAQVAAEAEQQIKDRNIDMQEIAARMPVFNLEAQGLQNNAIARYLQTKQIGFRKLFLDVSSRKRNGLRLAAVANAPYLGNVKLDSIQLGVWQSRKSLVYAAAVSSSADTWKGLFNINLSGRLSGDQARLELIQKNREGEVGFDLGMNLTLQDTAFTVSLFPVNPVLGYNRWMVNADNYITVNQDKKIEANLRLAYLNKLVSLQTLPDKGLEKDRLQVDIEGIDLKALSRMVPYMPDVEGNLNTSLFIYDQEHTLGVDGDIRIKELYYQQRRIGTVDLALQYNLGSKLTTHVVDFELRLDSIRRAIVQGEFATSQMDKHLQVDVDIPSFPLYVVNAFLPPDVLQLEGELRGGVKLRGTMDRPDVNGELAFQGGAVNVGMIGTLFRLDSSAIVVQNGQVRFNQYHITAPNGSTLAINGNIGLTPFDQIRADLNLSARNFEVVNVRDNPQSLIFGKAYADINAQMTGAFSDLDITGNINLLNRTNITYTLRNSGLNTTDKSVDMVRFVSFRDTTLNAPDNLTNRVNASYLSLKMLLEIGSDVRMNVNLSEDGSNNVAIQGGGNLVFAMNPESGLTLAGKYTLTSGSVTYNVPVVGKKEFSIQSGSFVEWTSDVANPTLNISASESVKATVEDGGRNRLVTFESIIRIRGTLSHPEITFDLSAPNDMVIQNQLATFSPEERTRQAMNLLIYNTYTAPGSASTANTNVANNALYSFMENEVNKYLKKTGFSIGVDSYNTDENTTRTDYTYQFSKQLFNDRVRVKIGGRVSTDNGEGQQGNLQENLVDDISIEYVFTKKRNLFLKVFRHTNYESVLEGEVTQTGIGIVWRKNFLKLKDLFIRKSKRTYQDGQNNK